MTALSISLFAFPTFSFRRATAKVQEVDEISDAERRELVNEMITAGACDSEYGVQMLMSVYPRQF